MLFFITSRTLLYVYTVTECKRYEKKDTRKESIRKWQRKQWNGAITKEFFQSLQKRLAVNLNLRPKVTTIMTGHGNIRSSSSFCRAPGS